MLSTPNFKLHQNVHQKAPQKLGSTPQELGSAPKILYKKTTFANLPDLTFSWLSMRPFAAQDADYRVLKSDCKALNISGSNKLIL